MNDGTKEIFPVDIVLVVIRIKTDDLGMRMALLYKPKAFETPSPVKSQEGIGFWGVVGAVIVALLILSFF